MNEVGVISGIVKGITGQGSDGQAFGFRMDTNFNQLVSAGSLPYLEMTRQGIGWMVQDSNALAAVTALPTTTAGLTLFNNEPPGGKSYIIDTIFAASVVTTAAVSGHSLAYCLHPVGMTKPTADITAIRSRSGRASYGGFAVVDSGATVVNDGWVPATNAVNTSGVTTATAGGLVWAAEGRLIVPPTAGISVKAFGSITNLTYLHGFTWYEQQLAVNG